MSTVWPRMRTFLSLSIKVSSKPLLMAAMLLGVELRGPRWLGRLVRATAAAGLALPVLFLGMLLLVFLPASPWTLVFACAVGGVPFAFRQARVLWLEQATAAHVLASRALGAGWRHLLTFTLWPNLRPQGAALARLMFAVSVLELSGLSFLGLGGDPDQAELGVILRQHQAYLFRDPMLVLWPGLLLSGLLLVVHLVDPPQTGSRPSRQVE